jgi:hypothetical protein
LLFDHWFRPLGHSAFLCFCHVSQSYLNQCHDLCRVMNLDSGNGLSWIVIPSSVQFFGVECFHDSENLQSMTGYLRGNPSFPFHHTIWFMIFEVFHFWISNTQWHATEDDNRYDSLITSLYTLQHLRWFLKVHLITQKNMRVRSMDHHIRKAFCRRKVWASGVTDNRILTTFGNILWNRIGIPF